MCKFQKLRIPGFPVDHRIAINRPGLTPCPHRFIIESLVRHSFYLLAALLIINHHVIRGVVWPEMIFHGNLGMADGNIIQGRGPPVFGSPKQQLQVDQVIGYDIASDERGM